MTYKITTPQGPIHCEINLTPSKSESNRVLIIKQMCTDDFEILNLSDSQDTQTLKQLLEALKREKEGSASTYDVGAAGTTMRFLTAYFATIKGTRVLTGSDRMKQRPVKILVDVLRKLGAEIEYLENDGYPPLRITGKELNGGQIEMDGSVSSQYISALLMIAPLMPLGLVLNFSGEITSKPYINMTLKLMEHFGVSGIWQGNRMSVSPQQYYIKENKQYSIESDWSAASYWYAIAALHKHPCEIKIKGLKQGSIQGDSIVTELFTFFGVKTTFEEDGIVISKSAVVTDRFGFDFNDCPDIAQTIAVVCAGLNIHCYMSGLHTLKIKETDRALAAKNELAKINATLNIIDNNTATIDSGELNASATPVFDTYHDHRMAMSFATLSCVLPHVSVRDPEVVSKSYPQFWEHLKSAGFKIEQI